MGSKASKGSTEVLVRFLVTRELTYVTTADTIRAMLIAAGETVNEPDLSDVPDHDATDVVFRLLDANAGIGRDAWLTTVSDVTVEDESVSIEEVTETH